jgi:hypothetical protein
MALSRKKATTIALDPEDDRLLSHAARERGISRSEFIRQHLALVLEQYRRHPKPRSAGIVHALAERGNLTISERARPRSFLQQPAEAMPVPCSPQPDAVSDLPTPRRFTEARPQYDGAHEPTHVHRS